MNGGTALVWRARTGSAPASQDLPAQDRMEEITMNLMNHNAEGATIHLDPRELLMVMALVQEGRSSFECEGGTGKALDELFCSAVAGVHEARRNRDVMLVAQPELVI
tara:strand:+ start:15982 stop:16302 length:321 start_codon:yes stop_codon:yes gene_type:complete